jgi:hypothetical protein
MGKAAFSAFGTSPNYNISHHLLASFLSFQSTSFTHGLYFCSMQTTGLVANVACCLAAAMQL